MILRKVVLAGIDKVINVPGIVEMVKWVAIGKPDNSGAFREIFHSIFFMNLFYPAVIISRTKIRFFTSIKLKLTVLNHDEYYQPFDNFVFEE